MLLHQGGAAHAGAALDGVAARGWGVGPGTSGLGDGAHRTSEQGKAQRWPPAGHSTPGTGHLPPGTQRPAGRPPARRSLLPCRSAPPCLRRTGWASGSAPTPAPAAGAAATASSGAARARSLPHPCLAPPVTTARCSAVSACLLAAAPVLPGPEPAPPPPPPPPPPCSPTTHRAATAACACPWRCSAPRPRGGACAARRACPPAPWWPPTRGSSSPTRRR